jgi:hypothetical protein
MSLDVYTCTAFFGHWPVGTAAVVVSDSPLNAALTLKDALRTAGIPDDQNRVTESSMEKLDLTQEHAVILNNGDY